MGVKRDPRSRFCGEANFHALDEDFLSDLLAKLPGPKGKEKEGPYALAKTLLLKGIEEDERAKKIAGSVQTVAGHAIGRVRG